MAAESKDLFAFRRGFTDLLPNRSLDYARDDSLVRNLKLLVKLQFIPRLIYNRHFLQKFIKNLRIHHVSRIAPRRKI